MLLYSIKLRKASKRASETREQTLHRQEQNRTHLACAEGSALQCCSLALFSALCNVCRLAVQNSHGTSCCKQEQAGEVSLEVVSLPPSLQIIGPGPNHNGRNLVNTSSNHWACKKKCSLVSRPSARPPSMYCSRGQRQVAKVLKLCNYKSRITNCLLHNVAISLVTLKSGKAQGFKFVLFSSPRSQALPSPGHFLFFVRARGEPGNEAITLSSPHDKEGTRPQLSNNKIRPAID